MNFERYRQCGIRCFCVLLQNGSHFQKKMNILMMSEFDIPVVKSPNQKNPD